MITRPPDKQYLKAFVQRFCIIVFITSGFIYIVVPAMHSLYTCKFLFFARTARRDNSLFIKLEISQSLESPAFCYHIF